MNCPNCGGTVPPNVSRCTKCGSYVEQAVMVPVAPPQPVTIVPFEIPPLCQPSAPKSRLLAGLLGVFLGAFGVHRFYMGCTGIALAQLLISVIGGALTCGVLVVPVALWGLVEGILILVGVINHDGGGRPLT
jgi:TM2 domain-containing membrane protein YozV